ncbi:MAG: PQQ-like beta-propeller repeat protein [Planctomycetaceae bacterium]|nr:PQQ-like beta-propeller repeat protein [Planctomycetaceae bacterium]
MTAYRLARIAGPIALCLALDARAADWPQFRGPTGQGQVAETSIPLTWDEQQGIAWRAPVEGLGWSSPVVVADRIYLTSAVPQGDEAQLLVAECRALKDGSIVWRRELQQQTGEVEMHKKNSHASPSPVVDGDRVYVHFGPHLTACLKISDGSTVWAKRLDYSPQHGTGGSPEVFEDLLILCCDGRDVQYVVGLDTLSGNERWRTSRETSPSKGFSFSTPLIIEAGGRTQAICPGSEAVFAYDPRTGQEIWRCNYGDGYSVVPRPVYANGLVYICTGYNRPKLLAIDPTGVGDVSATHLKWEYDRSVPHNPSIAAVGDAVYFVSDKGVATCLDAVTGEERWQERLGGNFSASPIATEDRVYFQDEAGVCHVVKAAAVYELLATNNWAPGRRTYASFAVVDHGLLARSEDAIVLITGQ